MKTLIFISCLSWIATSFAQTKQAANSGNYFEIRQGGYIERVIKPWKYQYESATDTGPIKKIGEILFWRSKAIYDSSSKKYWKPHIGYDIYFISDSLHIKSLSNRVKLLSSCDSINIGGDMLVVGNFILFNASPCVDCAFLNIDYCRKIIKKIIDLVPDKNTYDWEKILKQIIIEKGKFGI